MASIAQHAALAAGIAGRSARARRAESGRRGNNVSGGFRGAKHATRSVRCRAFEDVVEDPKTPGVPEDVSTLAPGVEGYVQVLELAYADEAVGNEVRRCSVDIGFTPG